MPYPGVPKEKEPKMDRCVAKVMKTGKDKSSAIAICRTSIMSQKEPVKKEEAYKVVASAETHYVFSSNSKINASKEGTLVKDIEIFKAGTFKGIEFKTSALDKMVANFHYLKAFNIFPNVPMRADHPGFWSAGEVAKIGGYIEDAKRIGQKLVVDVRFTNKDMLSKVQDGSYISRSAEIGTYQDNNQVTYDPVLYGFAWVDIPAVEGLSPQFSFSKENVNLISLNESMDEKEQFPPVEKTEEESIEEVKVTEEVKEADEVKASKEEEMVEEIKEKEEVELSKTMETLEFSKAFPKEFAELQLAKEEKFIAFFDGLVNEGKLLPTLKEKEMAFAKSLSVEQFSVYESIKKESPVVIKFDADETKTESEEPGSNSTEPTADEKAEAFIKVTN